LVEKLSVFTFLVCKMLAMGLSLTFQAIIAPLRNFRLVLLALALNFILAPGYAWLLTIVIPLQRGHAIGILLLGAAAGAPMVWLFCSLRRLGCGEEWVHPKLEGKMTPKLKRDNAMNKGVANENVNRGNRATIAPVLGDRGYRSGQKSGRLNLRKDRSLRLGLSSDTLAHPSML
jgi:Sodium Bile acid symporter family